MAKKLLKFYADAAEHGGVIARLRLAVLTRMSSAKAKTEPDTAENIATFEKAIKEIKKEFNKK